MSMFKYICSVFPLHRILLAFMLVFTLVPVLLWYWCMQTFTYNIIVGKYLNSYVSTLTSHVSYNFAEFEDNINTCYLQLTLYPNIVNDIEKKKNIEDIMQYTFSNEQLISCAELITTDGVHTYSIDGKTPDFYKRISQDFIDQFTNTNCSIMEDVLTEDGAAYIVMGRRVFDYYSSKDLGYILFYTNVDSIAPLYAGLKTESSNIFIMAGDCIISHTDKAALGKNLWLMIPDSSEGNRQLSKHSIQQINLPDILGGKINMVVETSYENMFEIIHLLNKINLILLLVAFVVIFLVSKIVSKKCLAVVNKLNDDMIAFADKPEEYIPKNHHSEIASLEYCFNNMVTRIQDLITKNQKEQERKHIAELCTLQAQIKHHFVYNVLDIIFWKAHSCNQEEIKQIVLALSSFLRISLSHGSNFITVREEVKHAENYLILEQMRFEDLFDVEFHIAEDILDIKVLKIILQPLVENSIKHGFKDINYKGKIIVNGYLRNEDTLIFEVIDNGRGIACDPFAPSVHSLENKISYGLSNISERLRFEYGEESKIQFMDTNGNGTHVEVIIKYKNTSDTE